MAHGFTSSPVVVTGLGFITSIGNDSTEVCESLSSLKHGLTPVTFLDNPALPVKLVGSIKGFEVDSPYYQKWSAPERYQAPKELLRGLPPHGLYAYAAIEQALEDAGISTSDLRDDRTAFYCASAGSAFLLHHHLAEMHRLKGQRGSPFGVVSTIAGTLNFNLGAHYGFKGGNCGFVSACASSAHALGHAIDQIRLGRVDRVVVVGAEDVNAESILPFAAMRALSTQAIPERASCPFDRQRNGFVASGGAVALILENASTVGSSANPYGEIIDWAQSCDGFNPAISDPQGQGIASSMRRVLQSADMDAGEVDYLNAHATSTVQGDRSEARAICEVFGKHGFHPRVSSTKGLTGHPLSMAGAMETAFCMLALRQGFTPGNAHLQSVDPDEVGELHLISTTESIRPQLILKNSCGFGGSNVSLLLRPWN